MSPPPVKALLFDIGGVVVQSPLAAISAYERDLGIPSGYINSAIGAAAPHGAFQRLERGEMALDDRFFEQFAADVRNRRVWARITAATAQRRQKTNKEEGEKSSEVTVAVDEQTRHDDADAEGRAFEQAVARIDARALFWTMMRAARHPDPHMYPALRKLVALGRARAASSCPAERRAAFVVGALSNAVVFPAGVRDERGAPFDAGVVLSSGSGSSSGPSDSSSNPAATTAVDEEGRAGGEGRGGGAKDSSSTTAPIPPLFDTFLHSAHIGLRKPDPRVYALALQRLEAVLRGRGLLDAALRPADVLFLDDIGANLKAARAFGFRTCKVEIGRTREAVRVLEEAVGARLLVDGDKEGEGGGAAPAARGSKL